MHHADIFCLLMKKGITLTAIAEEEGVSLSVVSEVIRGKKTSLGVATAIAAKVDRSINTLWPNKYKQAPPAQNKAVA